MSACIHRVGAQRVGAWAVSSAAASLNAHVGGFDVESSAHDFKGATHAGLTDAETRFFRLYASSQRVFHSPRGAIKLQRQDAPDISHWVELAPRRQTMCAACAQRIGRACASDKARRQT